LFFNKHKLHCNEADKRNFMPIGLLNSNREYLSQKVFISLKVLEDCDKILITEKYP
jgi:hypothetical protein